MKRLNSVGSHVVALVVAVLVIGVAAFGAYTVQHQDKTADTKPTTTASSSNGAINDTADLTKAAAELDSSSSQVDSSLNDSSLDSDLNDLL
jgi:Mn2+/Fe2+ NRAMP family transporter